MIITDEEYFDIVSLFYDSKIIEQIKYGEYTAIYMTDSIIKTIKINDLFLRYIEGRGVLIILGMVSKNGKLHRNDLVDLNYWLNYVVDEIDKNIKIYTSPNKLTEPIFNRIIDKCKKINIDLNIEIQNDVIYNLNDESWKTYKIYKV